MSVEELVLQTVANSAILYIVIVLGVFLGWWTFAMSPRKLSGARSLLYFAGSLELVGLLAVALNWLPLLGVVLPEVLEQCLRAGVWVLVALAVTNMAVRLFAAWWRNESPEDILSRYWTRVRGS